MAFAAYAYAQAPASPPQQHCINGLVTFKMVGTGRLQACGDILQSDPKLASQLDGVTHLLAKQQEELIRLSRSVNSVGSNLDLAKQVQMLQALVAKLGTDPDTADMRANHLSSALDGLQTEISSIRADAADSRLLQAKLKGSLGDAIAQLDASEAKAELDDIRTEVHRIDETTTRTAGDVSAIRRTMDIQTHPERFLPPEEAKLYTEAQPLFMDLNTFTSRWTRAAQERYLHEQEQHHQQITNQLANLRAGTTNTDDAIHATWAPLLADYGTNLLPALNRCRAQLTRVMPALSDIPAFEPATDKSDIQKAQAHLLNLLQRYTAGTAQPSPELAREGHELMARLNMLSLNMQQIVVSAMSKRQIAPPPPRSAPQLPSMLGETYVEDVDGPLRKEFLSDIEPRLMTWQAGVKKFFPDFRITDFSSASTSKQLRDLQLDYNQQYLHVSMELQEQIRNSSSATP